MTHYRQRTALKKHPEHKVPSFDLMRIIKTDIELFFLDNNYRCNFFAEFLLCLTALPILSLVIIILLRQPLR